MSAKSELEKFVLEIQNELNKSKQEVKSEVKKVYNEYGEEVDPAKSIKKKIPVAQESIYREHEDAQQNDKILSHEIESVKTINGEHYATFTKHGIQVYIPYDLFYMGREAGKEITAARAKTQLNRFVGVEIPYLPIHIDRDEKFIVADRHAAMKMIRYNSLYRQEDGEYVLKEGDGVIGRVVEVQSPGIRVATLGQEFEIPNEYLTPTNVLSVFDWFKRNDEVELVIQSISALDAENDVADLKLYTTSAYQFENGEFDVTQYVQEGDKRKVRVVFTSDKYINTNTIDTEVPIRIQIKPESALETLGHIPPKGTELFVNIESIRTKDQHDSSQKTDFVYANIDYFIE